MASLEPRRVKPRTATASVRDYPAQLSNGHRLRAILVEPLDTCAVSGEQHEVCLDVFGLAEPRATVGRTAEDQTILANTFNGECAEATDGGRRE